MVTKEILQEALAKRIGQKAFERLQQSAVAVAGLGGLGSHIAVMLARSGVGNSFWWILIRWIFPISTVKFTASMILAGPKLRPWRKSLEKSSLYGRRDIANPGENRECRETFWGLLHCL